MQSAPLLIDGESLTLSSLVEVARKGRRVALGPAAAARIRQCREAVERLMQQGRPIYGLNTGFGRLAEVAIPCEKVEELQRNLILSHACGVGPPLPAEAVRAAMVLRANALARGHSGVRPELVLGLLELVNRGIHPVVPGQGSLGASGDLAPLSHIALVLMGEGEAEFGGRVLSGAEALAAAGLKPVTLQAKEGLALINGSQVTAAVGALAAADAITLAQSADCVAALTLEGLRGIAAAFDPRIQAVRPHPGQAASAANVRRLLEGSRLVTLPGEARVQDAYCLRCVPQVHGASRDAMAHVVEVLEREFNSATDNPLVFPDDGDVLSGGNFHGQPLALALDYLGMAAAELGDISERRTERLTNPSLSGLPAFLASGSGLHSGYMVAQYTAASLVSENKVLAHPASVDSIPASAGQEDHVSMGTTAARKARMIVDNVLRVLAVEALCAAQAADFRGPELLGRGTSALHRALRRLVPPLRGDRVLAPEVEAVARWLAEGGAVRAVREAVPALL
ncbi:MAG: histidine ammonia-lyase [Acetobacteraceae bacterium]|nr:histidine ammonia-lyase [Acetobacteraceae bacterium]